MKLNWLGKYALGVLGASLGLHALGSLLEGQEPRRKIACPKCEGSFDVGSLTCDDCGWVYRP